MGKEKKIRIKDIAQMAGVSEGTVDRVIHNRGNVAEETKKKIQAILHKTDYSPNPIAQSLGSKKSYSIIVLIPDPEQDEYWKLSDFGIDQAKKEWEPYNVYIEVTTFDLDNPDSFRQATNQVLEEVPDAVLTVPIFFDELMAFFQQLHATNTPYILFNTQVNEQVKQHEPLCFIGQDLYQSGMVAAELMHIALRSTGTIAVMHIHENIENSIHLKIKERGFRNYFEELNTPDFEICTYTFLDVNESFELQIGDCIANNDLKGLYIPTSSGASITARALEKHNKQETVVIGYDLLEENIKFLKKGTINFLINQNPRHQALQGLRYLANTLLLGLEIPCEDLLPLEIVTRQNYQSFLNHMNF